MRIFDILGKEFICAEYEDSNLPFFAISVYDRANSRTNSLKEGGTDVNFSGISHHNFDPGGSQRHHDAHEEI